MKNKVKHILAALTGCMLVGLSVPAYAHASDGEDYITISVDAVDNSGQMQYAIDSDDPSAFSNINEFTIPTGTSHTIYVKDAAGNITSQKYSPEDSGSSYTDSRNDDEQQINIDLELGNKEEEEYYFPNEEGNPGTASVTSRIKTDGSVDAEKVFYTFTTKEGEELYLVVDQGRGTDNVYLLDAVSLGDLRVLADGHESAAAEKDKSEDNLFSSLTGEAASGETLEEIPEEKPKSKSGGTFVILLFAVIGGGIYYYLKIYRTKKEEVMDAMDAMDMDEFEAEEEEEELDFDYDDSEKERYLEALVNNGEKDLYDQDPEAYAASHMEDVSSEGADEEIDPYDEDDEEEDMYADIEFDF